MPLLPDRSFWEWGAGWAFGLLILAATLAREIASRHRPRRIVFREVARTTLVRLQQELGDRVTIRFDRKQVKSLAQLESELTNTGSDEIKDITLTVTFNEHTKLLDASATMLPGMVDCQVIRDGLPPNVVRLQIPYLNSFKLYRQKIRATFVCNGSLDNVRVQGGGAGWSVTTQHAATREFLKQDSRRVRVAALVCGLLAIPFYVAASNHDERSRISDQMVALGLHSEELRQKGLPRDAPELRADDARKTELREQQTTAFQKSFTYSFIGSLLAAGALFLLALSLQKSDPSLESPVEEPPADSPPRKGKPARRERPATEDQPAQGEAQETPASP